MFVELSVTGHRASWLGLCHDQPHHHPPICPADVGWGSPPPECGLKLPTVLVVKKGGPVVSENSGCLLKYFVQGRTKNQIQGLSPPSYGLELLTQPHCQATRKG